MRSLSSKVRTTLVIQVWRSRSHQLRERNSNRRNRAGGKHHSDTRTAHLVFLVAKTTAHRDYPIIQGVTLIFSGVYVIVNLMVDLSYTLLDPRIRY